MSELDDLIDQIDSKFNLSFEAPHKESISIESTSNQKQITQSSNFSNFYCNQMNCRQQIEEQKIEQLTPIRRSLQFDQLQSNSVQKECELQRANENKVQKSQSQNQIISEQVTSQDVTLGNQYKQLGQYENDNQDEGQSYRELSSKLEMALNKMQAAKTMRPKTNDFFTRAELFQKKKNIQIQMLRKEQENKIEHFKHKPLLNSQSLKMMNDYQPIHLRAQKIIENKNKKIEEKQIEKVQKELEEQQKVQKQFQEYMASVKKKVGIPRTSEQYYEEMKKWQEQRLRNIAELEEKEDQNRMNGITFSPSINVKSKLLMKKNNQIPIYDRQIQPKKQPLPEGCTFKPNLNKPKKKE